MTEPVHGDGQVQWNAGGWFGGQIGGTLWLGLLGVLIAATDWIAGAWPLVCFAIANGVGLALWARRDRMAPYPALQIQLAVTTACAFAGVLGLDLFDRLEDRTIYGWLLIYPLLMAVFHFREHMAPPKS